MDLGEIFSVLEGFDLNNFIPPLNEVLGSVQFWVQLAVLAGPLVLLGLGAWYFFAPPKEANHAIGFRTFWGMGSVAAWRYTQKLAGMVWGILGAVLTFVMFIVSLGFAGMPAMAMAEAGAVCLIWELVLTALSVIGINAAVFNFFDKDGNSRNLLKDRKKK